MRCALCHNGETRPGTADKAFSQDGMTLVVKDVPAEICENDQGVVRMSEQVVAEYLERQAHV